MFERLKLLSGYMNVAGCENQIRDTLLQKINDKGFSAILNGSSIVVKKCGKKEKGTVMLTVPMDTPGFLALYTETGKALLAQTGNLPLDSLTDAVVSDEKGREYSLEIKDDASSEFWVSGGGFLLGDAFRLKTSLKQSRGAMEGWFSARTSLMLILLDVMEEKFDSNVIFSFTSGGSTRCTREIQIASQLCPDQVILLGTAESKGSDPVILAKDGKAFSDPRLVERALICAKESKITAKVSVFDQEVTKLSALASECAIPCLSVSLPGRNVNLKNESFFLSAHQKTKCLLTAILKSM